MFGRIGAAVARHPWRVIAAWVAAMVALSVVGGMKIYDVTTSEQRDLLSAKFESVKADDVGTEAFGVEEGTTSVAALFEHRNGARLSLADREAAAGVARQMPRFRPDWDEIGNKVPFLTDKRKDARAVAATLGPVSADGTTQLLSVSFKGNVTDPATQEAFKQFRAAMERRSQSRGLEIAFTGGAATYTDAVEAGEDGKVWESLLLYGGVALLTLLFFRGLLAAVLPMIAVFLVGGGAGGLITLAAVAFDFKLEANTPSLITVVLIGIGIDYFLFLLFRHRERLRAGDGRKDAAVNAVAKVGAVIASAALAIVVAFATLGLAEFGQFRMLGPAVAIAVLVMLVAGVTFFPAIVAVTGRALYWPSKSWQWDRHDGAAARVGRLVATRPALVAGISTVVLAVLAVGAIGSKIAFDVGGSEATTAATKVADTIETRFSRGAADPVQVYVRADRPLSRDRLAEVSAELRSIEGIASVATPVLAPGGRVARIDATLRYEADASEAMDLVEGPLRDLDQNAGAGTEVLIGGTPAVFADVKSSVNRDLRLIFPVAAALILLILVALLRAVVAPVYLLLAVGLEFLATFGATALLFQHTLGRNGVAFSLPIVLYLFVVAIGTDYNMLIASRLREGIRDGLTTRAATANAVRFAAPAMAAAGLALATSFSSLLFYKDEAQKQMGFGMAAGILLASLVVSSLLVPALTALIGPRAWWPARQRRVVPAEVAPDQPLERAA